MLVVRMIRLLAVKLEGWWKWRTLRTAFTMTTLSASLRSWKRSIHGRPFSNDTFGSGISAKFCDDPMFMWTVWRRFVTKNRVIHGFSCGREENKIWARDRRGSTFVLTVRTFACSNSFDLFWLVLTVVTCLFPLEMRQLISSTSTTRRSFKHQRFLWEPNSEPHCRERGSLFLPLMTYRKN